MLLGLRIITFDTVLRDHHRDMKKIAEKDFCNGHFVLHFAKRKYT